MYSSSSLVQQNPLNFKEFAATSFAKATECKAKKNLKSSIPLRFKARRAEGGCGGNSARQPVRRSFNAGGAQPVPFGYFQTDTADVFSYRETASAEAVVRPILLS